MNAISKGSLADCLVQLDGGSTDRLGPAERKEDQQRRQRNHSLHQLMKRRYIGLKSDDPSSLRIPEPANKRTIPSWLFDARLSVRDRLISKVVLMMPFW